MSRALQQPGQRTKRSLARSGEAGEVSGTLVKRRGSKAAPVNARAVKLTGKLADTIAEIKRLYGEVRVIEFTAWQKSLLSVIRIGELLYRVKESPGWRGKWLNWLKANVPFDARTAQRYMKCYKRRDDLPEFLKRTEAGLGKTTAVSYLTDTYLFLTAPKTGSSKRDATRQKSGDGSTEHLSTSITDAEAAPPHRKHKSQKQVMRELQRISEQEQEAERQTNAQLSEIIARLDRKVRSQWLEFPDRLTAHGEKLVKIAEYLKLNTPRQ
jgi:hypothetical protein